MTESIPDIAKKTWPEGAVSTRYYLVLERGPSEDPKPIEDELDRNSHDAWPYWYQYEDVAMYTGFGEFIDYWEEAKEFWDEIDHKYEASFTPELLESADLGDWVTIATDERGWLVRMMPLWAIEQEDYEERLLKNLDSPEYDYFQLDTDILSAVDYHIPFVIPVIGHITGVTGVVAKMGEATYNELWVCTGSRPYDIYSTYIKVFDRETFPWWI